MNPTRQLHDLGQSLWLDNITRTLLDDGTLAALHRRRFDHGPHIESEHLRRSDRRRPCIRR